MVVMKQLSSLFHGAVGRIPGAVHTLDMEKKSATGDLLWAITVDGGAAGHMTAVGLPSSAAHITVMSSCAGSLRAGQAGWRADAHGSCRRSAEPVGGQTQTGTERTRKEDLVAAKHSQEW